MPYHHGRLREALLERAAEVIAEGGVESLSLRGLARDLGVSHAAPGRHFADRAALLRALAVEAFERSVAAMDLGAEAAGADPVARYRALGRSYVAFARSQPAFFRAMHHPAVRASADGTLHDVVDEWFARLREGAAAAQAAGWHPEADPEVLVAFSVAAAFGAATILSEGFFGSHLNVDDVESFADGVLALVVERTGESKENADEHTSDERRAS